MALKQLGHLIKSLAVEHSVQEQQTLLLQQELLMMEVEIYFILLEKMTQNSMILS